jgi:hypothetical protein
MYAGLASPRSNRPRRLWGSWMAGRGGNHPELTYVLCLPAHPSSLPAVAGREVRKAMQPSGQRSLVWSRFSRSAHQRTREINYRSAYICRGIRGIVGASMWRRGAYLPLLVSR